MLPFLRLKNEIPNKVSIKPLKYLYLKGGNAVNEITKLENFKDEIPNTGPDQFYLSIKKITQKNPLRLITLGNNSQTKSILNIEAIEYALRPKTSNKIKKLWFFLKESLTFCYQTIQYKPSIIFCGVDGVFSIIVIFIAKITRSHLIFLSHNAINLLSVSKLNRAANQYLVKHTDIIITHGPFLTKQALSLGAKSNHIYEFDTWPSPILSINLKNIQTTDQIILFLGRIETNKGVEDLLRAYQQLPNNKNTQLWFLGTGSLLFNIKKAILQLQIKNQIKFLGSVPHEKVKKYILQANFIVTPTQSHFPEGRCMSVMEAFANGKAVIAPNFGPFPYLVKHKKNGLLYEADSVEDLTDQMHLLLSNKTMQKKLNQNALSYSQKKFKKQSTFIDTVTKAIKYTQESKQS